ncbi:hypothetical protein D3C81_2146990 [compost metagenome]
MPVAPSPIVHEVFGMVRITGCGVPSRPWMVRIVRPAITETISWSGWSSGASPRSASAASFGFIARTITGAFFRISVFCCGSLLPCTP